MLGLILLSIVFFIVMLSVSILTVVMLGVVTPEIARSFDLTAKKSNCLSMEQHTFKNANNCLNTNINSYLETSRGQSSNLYLNVVHFFNASVN